MQLQWIDWVVIIVALAVCFIPSLFFGRRSGKSTAEFFASGRSVPWWLIGISMVATTFSSDTPNLVTDIVRRHGVAGNWVWWAFALTSVATVFFYAKLWRRSGVLTDLEFYEMRYSGTAAKAVRGFRSVYLGLLFNCLIMASVNLAACKIANILFGLERWETLGFIGLLNVVFAAYSGLWGVLVIDMIQFFIMMAGVIAAAYFALAHPMVGGLEGMVEKVSALKGPGGLDYMAMMPDFTNNWDLALIIFVMPIAVQWWAVWYPGMEPGGGSYMAQRMLSARSERDALGGVLFFNVAHYVLRPWPWIIVALCSLIVFPQLGDIQEAFPQLDAGLLGHDMAYPAMLKFLPVGFMGLMVAALIAANSSTILTHLNWGASYLVHDFYSRFIHKGASEKHYVFAGRICTILLFVCAGLLTFVLESAKDTFDIILQVGAGTGLLYLARWFWWRITAWCEVAAMISSFLLSVGFLLLRKWDAYGLQTHHELVLTIVFTTVCWLLVAYFGPQTDEKTLIEFYQKVRPGGLGWRRIRSKAGPAAAAEDKSFAREIPAAIIGWLVGCMLMWCALFCVGNFLYGRLKTAWALVIVCVVCAGILLWAIRRLWSGAEGSVPQKNI